MYEWALKGALVSFVLLAAGATLVGPCGPSSWVVHVLMFPGLLLSQWIDGGATLMVVVIQLGFGALVGASVARVRRRT